MAIAACGSRRERGRARAAAADLLLDRRDRDDVDHGELARREPAGGLEHRVGAEPVVEPARDEPPVRKLERRPVPDARVARRDEGRRRPRDAFAAPITDVVGRSGRSATPCERLGRRPRAPGTITPSTGPAVAGDRHPLAREHFAVDAAERREGQQAGGLDVGDGDADLVDVADEREGAAAAGADARERGAERVAAHLGKGCGRLAPDPARGLLVAGRAGSAQERPEQVGNRHQLADPRSRAAHRGRRNDDFLPAADLVELARERGGSLRLSRERRQPTSRTARTQTCVGSFFFARDDLRPRCFNTDLLTPLGAYLRLRWQRRRQLSARVGRPGAARALLARRLRLAARLARRGGALRRADRRARRLRLDRRARADRAPARRGLRPAGEPVPARRDPPALRTT